MTLNERMHLQELLRVASNALEDYYHDSKHAHLDDAALSKIRLQATLQRLQDTIK